MEIIEITGDLQLRKESDSDKWYIQKRVWDEGYNCEFFQSEEFNSKESALYHLCTNQIQEWN